MLSLAKKKLDKILINANAGTPYPKNFKAIAVISTSFWENDPYPNNALTISSDAIIIPKLAGTEIGIDDPTPIFSACFGSPFMPLNPLVYANMLIKQGHSDMADILKEL